jgi:hypothetical protein
LRSPVARIRPARVDPDRSDPPVTAETRRVLPALLTCGALPFVVACTTRLADPIPTAAPILPAGASAYDAALRIRLPDVPPDESPDLHNVYRLSGQVISGSEPHGEAGFAKLRELGVRTILSVDGKVPDEATARRFGMRYVHVPIQYRGIASDEMLRIAKTFRECEGPFYVHCFHGKHRGPAAAAVGRIALDGATREQALAEMRQWCGTAQSYEGLYRTIALEPIPSAATTAAFAWDFPAAHPFDGFRHAMIEISRADDQLKYLARREWAPDAAHPDIDARNEATKLAILFERAQAIDELRGKPADFLGWMRDSAAAAARLRDELGAWRAGSSTLPAVDRAYKQVSTLCTTCHRAYRDD